MGEATSNLLIYLAEVRISELKAKRDHLTIEANMTLDSTALIERSRIDFEISNIYGMIRKVHEATQSELDDGK